MTIAQDLQKSVKSPYIEMLEFDGTKIHSSLLFYFTNSSDYPISFGGKTYTPFPFQGTGWEATSGQPPRPKLVLSNVSKLVQPYIQQYQDLTQATVTRVRTLAKYLDGTGTADGTQYLPKEVSFINALTRHEKTTLEFELVSVLEAPNRKLPAGQVLKDNTPGIQNMYAPGLSTTRFRG